ncbi:MAG: sugar ABC transporter substrate-binding protein [Chloroflexota bacterium]
MFRHWKILLLMLAITLVPMTVLGQDQPVTLRVVGFVVPPEEIGTPLDQAYQDFLATFQENNPNVTVEALETPPEFDTQLLTDLAAGTAPDVWQQDGSTLARLIDTGNVLDMRQCLDVVPELSLDRFYPSVLNIHMPEGEDGPIYGLPNDFTPMVIYYNPLSFENAGVEVPTPDWTWEDFLDISQRLTLDAEGRNATDPDFDPENIVQYGYRHRHYVFEWIYWVWQNGGDVIAPDGSTVDGYLNSPETIEAITFLRDLVLEHHVSPEPVSLEQMTQQAGFLPVFLEGDVAMFPRGHWELVGLRNQSNYEPERVAVISNPSNVEEATVIYESGWIINNAVAEDPAKLEAACRLVEAATDMDYQLTKGISGVAIPANQAAAEQIAEETEFPELEQAFLEAVAAGRPPYGARFAIWPIVEQRLDLMMENILAGGDIQEEVDLAVEEINRELERAGQSGS